MVERLFINIWSTVVDGSLHGSTFARRIIFLIFGFD